MATVQDFGDLWNTTAGLKQLAIASPTVNDLVVVVHGMSDWISGDTSVCTDNHAGGTYTQIGANPLSSGGGTGGALWVSVRNNLIAATTPALTVSCTNTGDTGGGLTLFTVVGVTRTGSSAARQSKGESTQTENPPSIAFAAATLTANPIFLAVFGEDNPPALTSPTGFTEAFDGGWATPTSGVWVGYRASGGTLSTYAWTGGALTDHNEVGVEIDTSAAAAPYTSLVMSPRGRRP